MQISHKNILFLTTANLPTNPRLLKEIDILAQKNEAINIFQFKLGNWSDRIDREMRVQRPNINFTELDATRSNIIHWTLWAIFEKTARILWPLFKHSLLLTALAHSRRALMLRKKINQLKTSPDLIIAHNLGSLYPAWWLSRKKNIPFIFDIEDYDPGIVVPQTGKRYKDYSEKLMKKCLPDAKALTSASPLIGKYSLKLIDGHPNHHVVLNSFPEEEFLDQAEDERQPPIPAEKKTEEKKGETSLIESPPWGDLGGQLKLVWFSQHISFGRGLEQFFEAIALHPWGGAGGGLHLTLIGHLNPAFDQQIIQPFLTTQNTEHGTQNPKLKILNPITYTHLPPLTQPQLHAELSNHDIGLALEFNNTDLNRQLCLTNKIIAYAQAGLYIMATDTPAQKQFMEEDSGRGIICGQTPEEMAEALKEIIEQKEEIKKSRNQRFGKGMELAWEKEAGKLEEIWKGVMGVPL